MAKSKQLKQLQRRVNKRIRAINNNVLNDSLWNGRFIIYQVDRYFKRYGGDYSVLAKLKFVDLMTGKSKYCWLNDYEIMSYQIWFDFNNFICDCRQETEKDGFDPYEDKTIYRIK